METLSTLVKFRSLVKKWGNGNFCSDIHEPASTIVCITYIAVCINRAISSGLLQIKCSNKLVKGHPGGGI